MDKFKDIFDTPIAPARRLAAVVPSDADPLPIVAKALYVGTAGDLRVRGVDDALPVTMKVQVGYHPIAAAQVYATGTTAADIVACL